MSLADLDEIKFAKALVNPDKLVRDATLSSLQSVLAQSKNITDVQMLKLWKALFYCMWLADMNPVQMELATNVADMIKVFPKPKGALLYIQMFFRTIVREWHHLDQYRLNKFYTLIRSIVHKSFEYIAGKKWRGEVVQEFLGILETEVLLKVPNGVRYHMADIYLSEIWNATQGEVSTEQFLVLLQPFVAALSAMDDKVFHQRIVKKIFQDFLENHSAHLQQSAERPQVFTNVSTASIQAAIFDSAAHKSTKESHRKVLYELHKAYQLACQGNKLTKAVSISVEVDSASDSKTKKKKSKAAEDPLAHVQVAVGVAAEPVKVSKKRKQSVDETDTPVVADVETSSKKVRFGKKLAKGY